MFRGAARKDIRDAPQPRVPVPSRFAAVSVADVHSYDILVLGSRFGKDLTWAMGGGRFTGPL